MLIPDFMFYRDPHGLNQLESNGYVGSVSDNGVLFTAEYLICLLYDKQTPLPDKISEMHRICKVLSKMFYAPGITWRSPGNLDNDSMDNNIAMLVIDYYVNNGRLAKEIYKHGSTVKCDGLVHEDQRKYYNLANALNLWRGPKFFYTPGAPSKFLLQGWFGRSPGFMGFLEICALGKTSWFKAFCLFVGQFIGSFADRGNTDARKLPYVVWQVLAQRGGIWALGYKVWKIKLNKDYANGMKDVYDIYYPGNHPIKRYTE